MPQKIHPWNTKNRPAVGRISCLAELGSRPIQAEPVQFRPEMDDVRFIMPHTNYSGMHLAAAPRGPIGDASRSIFHVVVIPQIPLA